jgi:hypothetical protein
MKEGPALPRFPVMPVAPSTRTGAREREGSEEGRNVEEREEGQTKKIQREREKKKGEKEEMRKEDKGK